VDISSFINNIFNPNSSFEDLCLQAFKYQYHNNKAYRQWCNLLLVQPEDVKAITQIPFLPVQFFKTHTIISGSFEPEIIFESSGTTQTINSQHFVKDISIYHQSFVQAFELFYGDIKDWCIIGLLPSYLERKGSSLVMMVDELIQKSHHPHSGFYLYEYEKLAATLQDLEANQQKTLLIGVTYALLDFAEQFAMPLQHTIVMETGGMKGKRKEMTRQEVNKQLQLAFGLQAVHSEYGMTELLSQAYSKGNGIFNCPPWMKVLVRNEEDPLQVNETGRGVLNIIDLANIHSCCFVAVDDAATIHLDNSFEVLGRVDNSDIRGCSLMVV
jgi:phenylacetate-coenzyme A ligase PaaK-like adenylate-forming protein